MSRPNAPGNPAIEYLATLGARTRQGKPSDAARGRSAAGECQPCLIFNLNCSSRPMRRQARVALPHPNHTPIPPFTYSNLLRQPRIVRIVTLRPEPLLSVPILPPTSSASTPFIRLSASATHRYRRLLHFHPLRTAPHTLTPRKSTQTAPNTPPSHPLSLLLSPAHTTPNRLPHSYNSDSVLVRCTRYPLQRTHCMHRRRKQVVEIRNRYSMGYLER